ncbi:MAG: PfkB family carbohydrate kinase [Solirubrobacteraceae bacterium]
MSLTVVGSLAFDAVKTPSGSRDRMLGGAATHFALAASFFTEVRPVGPVGDDFGPDEFAVLQTRGTICDDVEHVAGGKTFFWAGEYHDNLNTRTTLRTDLNVFEHFEPKLSPEAQDCDVLFLANIQPDLQYKVRQQCANARFVAMDSMNLWIDIAHDSLVRTIRSVDCLILNDEELEQLTGAPTTVKAAEELLGWGLKAVVAKQGKYGAGLFTEDGYFAIPAYPLPAVADPTGAGDTFAGGFVGYVAAQTDAPPSHELFCEAMAYGTALASFNVEEFGTERVARLTGGEVAERVGELQGMTRFEIEALALRG